MPISEKWIPQLQEMIEQGLSNSEIARELGMNAHAVSDRIRLSKLRTQRRGGPSGSWNGAWKGGRRTSKDGYILTRFEHPRSTQSGYFLEHVLVMEAHLGRLLQEGEVVHHRNGNRKDNNINNLELYSSNANHLKAELTGRSQKEPRLTENTHHCSGYENHPLIMQQPGSVRELASLRF